MAKEPGDIRSSSWENNPYYENGERKNYGDLSAAKKEIIKQIKNKVADEMWANLKNKFVMQVADGKQIKIEFDHGGVDHVARDAMMTLSGKYMSRESMINIDHILANSSYIPTNHAKKHPRDDQRQYWFKYQDGDGRGLYFSVAHSPKSEKKYTLYSIADKLED